MNILKRKSPKGDKITFYYDYGRGPGQRPSTGIFIYTKTKDQIQKNHNREALALLETKKSQAIIEQQAIGSAYIPQHIFKANFLEYFEDYVKLNARKGNRHLTNCLAQFKLFISKDFIAPIEITENFCKRFRQYLLDKYKGETPANYYAWFKWVVSAAKSDKYFHENPTEKVFSKSNKSTRIKDHLEIEEYLALLRTRIAVAGKHLGPEYTTAAFDAAIVPRQRPAKYSRQQKASPHGDSRFSANVPQVLSATLHTHPAGPDHFGKDQHLGHRHKRKG